MWLPSEGKSSKAAYHKGVVIPHGVLAKTLFLPIPRIQALAEHGDRNPGNQS